MDFEKKNQIPEGIKILGWLISLCAFALGFYHTAEGMKFFKPLGFEGGAFIVSALISMLLIVAYSRAVAGVKVALIFYIVCALFNFTFNLNSFYPNLNSRKLLQEEAKTISDTLIYNLSRETKIGKSKAADLETKLGSALRQCLNEIKNSKGFGEKAKDQLKQFNKLAAENNLPTIAEGSYDVNNPTLAEFLKNEMTIIMEESKKGMAQDSSKVAAYQKFQELKLIKSFADSIFEKIDVSRSKKDENISEWDESITALKKIVKVNDEVSKTINDYKISHQSNGRVEPIKFHVLNPNDAAELKYPKSEHLGEFNHTIDSMVKRIDKIDTWGVIILVFFIDFLVPFAIYFLIRKRPNDEEDQGGMGGQSEGFFSKLFGKKQPQQF
ncbi:MAG: hypothetical protein ACK45H_11260 [Bacteroidota bacterium]